MRRWLALLLLLPLPLAADGIRVSTRTINQLSGGATYSRVRATLTEGTVTTTMRVTVAAEAGTSGTYSYTIYATDGSTPQVRSGRVIFSATADGATETCVLGTPEETDNTPTGTLTVTVSCSTSPTQAIDLQLNATSSLTQTSLYAYTHVFLLGPGTVTPHVEAFPE